MSLEAPPPVNSQAQAQPAALVLCGGESRRMGQPKAWLPFGSETLLQRVLRLMSGAASPIVVVRALGQSLPELPSEILIAEDAVACRGPLEALAAGLAALPDSVELVYVTATDVPFLNPAWITELTSYADGHDLVIPQHSSYFHPLAALYRRGPALLATRALINAGQFRLLDLMAKLPTKVVGTEDLQAIDPTFGTLRNLNTFDDYQQAVQEWMCAPVSDADVEAI